MKRTITMLLTAAVAVAPAFVLAEQPPTRGMSKAEVKARLGSPNSKAPAVGAPPISRWRYDGYTVYFENDLTLHTVLDQPKPSRKATSPAPRDAEEAGGEAVEPAKSQQPRSPGVKSGGGPRFDPTSGRFTGGEREQPNAGQAQPPAKPSTSEKPKSDDPVSAKKPTTPAESDNAATTRAPAARSDAPSADGGDRQEGEFRFDPVSGRIVMPGREKAAAPAQETPLSSADEQQPDPEKTPPTAGNEPEAQTATPARKEETEEKSDGGYRIDWNNR